MSTIRLLFAPENIGFADKIARALAAQGYHPTAEEGPAAATLVVWSPAAAASPAILAQARSALARRVLVPVALGKSPPPPSFEHLWPMDLAGWTGRDDDPRWRFVLDEVELAVRRGVDMAPKEELVLAETAAAPAARSRAPVERAPPRRGAYDPPPRLSTPPPSAGPPVNLEEMFAPPAHGRSPAAAARPAIPRAAIAAGFLVVLLPLGAFFLGSARPPSAASGDRPAAPIVAYAEPNDQPTEEIGKALTPEAETETTPPAAAAPPQAEELRDGVETSNLAAGEAAPQAADTVVAEAGDPEAADEAFVEPEIKPATIASLAEAAIGAGPAPGEGDAALEETDRIAELAFQATGGAVAEAAAFGNYFRDCIDCPDMAEVRVASAELAPASAPGAVGGFAIGVREVTFEQWRACVADGACPKIATEAGPDGLSLPVIKVSHQDAMAYAAWLSARTGVTYRLPSEAEWEYAARAGGAPLGVGVPPDPRAANVRGPTIFRGRTMPVGSFAPNGLGLYDMAGNVWEWTGDCAAAAAAATTASVSAAPGAAAVGAPTDACVAHILKGGAYDTPVSGIEDAYRAAAPADARRTNTGFRVARDIN